MKIFAKFLGGFMLGFVLAFVLAFVLSIVLTVLENKLGNTGLLAILAAVALAATPRMINTVRVLTGQKPVQWR